MLTPGKIAQLLCVAPRTVAKWCDAGQLKAYRVPESLHRRISEADFVTFVQEYKISITPQIKEIIDKTELQEKAQPTPKPVKRYTDIPRGAKFKFTQETNETWIKLSNESAVSYDEQEFKRCDPKYPATQLVTPIREPYRVDVVYLG